MVYQTRIILCLKVLSHCKNFFREPGPSVAFPQLEVNSVVDPQEVVPESNLFFSLYSRVGTFLSGRNYWMMRTAINYC